VLVTKGDKGDKVLACPPPSFARVPGLLTSSTPSRLFIMLSTESLQGRLTRHAVATEQRARVTVGPNGSSHKPSAWIILGQRTKPKKPYVNLVLLLQAHSIVETAGWINGRLTLGP
jgi:hypothetical protein